MYLHCLNFNYLEWTNLDTDYVIPVYLEVIRPDYILALKTLLMLIFCH
jgi:hypothetical protein